MISTIKCTGRRKVVVQFVKELLRHFDVDYQSITITPQVKSGVCSARIVIDTLWEDTVKDIVQSYSKVRTTISYENTRGG
jgi:hypothetical protein